MFCFIWQHNPLSDFNPLIVWVLHVNSTGRTITSCQNAAGGKSLSVFVTSMSTKLPIEREKENNFSNYWLLSLMKLLKNIFNKYLYFAKNANMPCILPVTYIDVYLCFFPLACFSPLLSECKDFSQENNPPLRSQGWSQDKWKETCCGINKFCCQIPLCSSGRYWSTTKISRLLLK